MATHSSTFAWRIPWMEQAAVHGVAKSWTWLSDFTFTFHFHPLEKEMATHSSILDWRISGMGEPGGLPPMGLQSQTWLTWLSSSSSRNDGGERKAGNFVFSIILHDIMPTILLCFGNYSFEQSVSHLVSESTWHVLTHKCVLSVHTHTLLSHLCYFLLHHQKCAKRNKTTQDVYTHSSPSAWMGTTEWDHPWLCHQPLESWLIESVQGGYSEELAGQMQRGVLLQIWLWLISFNLLTFLVWNDLIFLNNLMIYCK